MAAMMTTHATDSSPVKCKIPIQTIGITAAYDHAPSTLPDTMFGRMDKMKQFFDAYERIIEQRRSKHGRVLSKQEQFRAQRTKTVSGDALEPVLESTSEEELETDTEPSGSTTENNNNNGNNSNNDAKKGTAARSMKDETVGLDQHLIPALFVSGVSGTGKSKLMEEFFANLEDRLDSQQENDDDNMHRKNIYILRGKLDEYNGMNDPYIALSQAVAGFVRQLEQEPKEAMKYYQDKLEAGLSTDDIELLIQIVPSLIALLPSQMAPDQAQSTEGTLDASVRSRGASMSTAHRGLMVNASDTWKRVQFLFVRLIKIISSPLMEASDESISSSSKHESRSQSQSPLIVLSLDDLQWASSSTLTLLNRILLDPTIDNFMLFGTIREDEHKQDETEPETDLDADSKTETNPFALNLPSDNPMVDMMNTLHQLPGYDPTMSQVRLQNMSVDEVKEWLSSMLDAPTKTLESLSAKLHGKTLGNPFYTSQALQELQRERHIVFDEILFTWKWASNPDCDGSCDNDLHSLHSLSISNNIEDLVTAKMRRLPKTLQQLVTVASYIQCHFEVKTLQAVWDDIENLVDSYDKDLACWGKDESDVVPPGSGIDIQLFLETAVLEGLLHNTIGASSYRFAHDRIQQAAYNTIPPGEYRDKLRVSIGRSILDIFNGSRPNAGTADNANSSQDGDDGLLFIAADHLNSAPNKDKLFLTKLNLEVGDKSLSKGALTTASKYMEKAHASFQKVHGRESEKHYDLFIHLHQIRGITEAALGNYQVATKLFESVLGRANTLEEKLTTYVAMSKALAQQGQHVAALKVLLGVAQELQVFPKRWFALHAAKGGRGAYNFFKNYSDEEILSLPITTDPVVETAMELLNNLSKHAFATQSTLLWFVTYCEQVKLIKKHGLCRSSPHVLLSYAMQGRMKNDHETATRGAYLAKRIVEITNAKHVLAWVNFVDSAFICGWDKPYQEQFNLFEAAYKSSMQRGDMDSAFINWHTQIMHGYVAGQNLRSIVQAANAMTRQAIQYQFSQGTSAAKNHFKVMKSLMGEFPIDWDEVRHFGVQRDGKQQKDSVLELITGYWVRLQVLVYFFEYKKADEMADRFALVTMGDPSYGQVASRTMFSGLAAAGCYRETKQRKHLQKLKTADKSLGKMVRFGATNCLHRRLLVKAELRAIHSHHHNKVKQAYDSAILVARKNGFVHDAALASELAGEAFLRMKKEQLVADYFMDAIIPEPEKTKTTITLVKAKNDTHQQNQVRNLQQILRNTKDPKRR